MRIKCKWILPVLAPAAISLSVVPPRGDAAEQADAVRRMAPVQKQRHHAAPARSVKTMMSLLEKHGIVLGLRYTSEIWTHRAGGLETKPSHPWEYVGVAGLEITLDTEKLGLWPGGSICLSAESFHGEGLTNRFVGDYQVFSNIDPGTNEERTQLSEWWFEQTLAGGKVRLKVGKQDANADFCAVEAAETFINSSFGLIPNVPMPTYPDPTIGAAVFVSPTRWMTFAGGVYDGHGVGDHSGLDTAWNKHAAFYIGELTLRWFPERSAKPRVIGHVGVWSHTGDVEELVGDGEENGNVFDRNYGAYATLEGLLIRGARHPGRGLWGFVQLGWAPSKRNERGRYFGAGLASKGWRCLHDDDEWGLGVAWARPSHSLRKSEDLCAECAAEVFYKFQITPWLSLQPDVQYIFNPGSRGRDALVAGVRVDIGW